MRHWSLALSFALLGGCSLDTSGSAPTEESLSDSGTVIADTSGDDVSFDTEPPFDGEPIDSGTVDSTMVDTGMPPVDTGMPPVDTGTPPVDTGKTTMCADSGGAKRLGLVDRMTPCPPGFATIDVLEGTGGDGCTCGCSVTVKPTCPGSGSLATKYGTSTSCSSTGLTITPGGSDVCTALPGGGGNLADYFSGTAPGPIGGACGPSSGTDKTKVSRPRRLCDPIGSACVAPVCNTPFVECIESAGPCGGAYPNARTVGTDVILTCPACTCSLDSGTCDGKITFFEKTGCTGGTTALDVNDTCVATGSGGTNVKSYKYKPDPMSGAACNASFSSSPGTRTFVAQRNLCCR